jgi:5-methylcytosine-specific restriction endonuclease McrA
MIKYYWNQTCFFGLKQGKNPVILQLVRRMIDKYKKEVSSFPKPWNEVEYFFVKENNVYLNKIISKMLSNARTNVCPRFKNVSQGKTLDIYSINDKEKTILFDKDNINCIIDYAMILTKLLNYKWVQLLERYNMTPNISKKVVAASNSKIKRKSLNKYKKILVKYYHSVSLRDFYTNEILDEEDVHIDHVIPWSFIYSDDIWNLVITKSTNNLKKNNRPPTKDEIERLKKRNILLLKKLNENKLKTKSQIEYAIDNKILDKLFINMKG